MKLKLKRDLFLIIGVILLLGFEINLATLEVKRVSNLILSMIFIYKAYKYHKKIKDFIVYEED